MQIETKIAHFDSSLHLESGRILREFDLAYETYGKLNEAKDNVVVICHALTGSHHAAGVYQGEVKAGWWDGLIGDGKAIDTRKYFVICTNILGSSFGSTSPLSVEPGTNREYRLRFPVVVISDVVRAQMRLFERLGISSVRAVVGGSLGGMQALCYAIEHPDFARKIAVLASTYATPAWAIAFNKIAVSAILSDPAFKGGYYDPAEIRENGLSGMAIGRMAGHISFLSPSSMQAKFGRNYCQTDGLYELLGRYEVDRYLDYNGFNFSTRFDPLSYLYIVKMMNNFDATRHYGSDVLRRVKADLFLASFKSDMLFPPTAMDEMADELVRFGKKVHYERVDSDYGHDAFLVEVGKFAKPFCEWLEN